MISKVIIRQGIEFVILMLPVIRGEKLSNIYVPIKKFLYEKGILSQAM